MRLGDTIVRAYRTEPLGQTGVRSVWYLPGGISVHMIEDNPIPPGTYYLNPDDTGRFKNWVIESELGSWVAAAGRTHVEVHVGNTLEDTEGCSCPGFTINKDGVSNSRHALAGMRDALNRDEPDPPVWVLVIK